MQDNLSSFEHWEQKKQLGFGGFGEVLLWKHRLTNQEIATKRLKENNNLSCDEVNKLKHRWQQEIQWMTNINLEYIVRSVEVDSAFFAYLNQNHVWRPLPVIVMEYCNAGDLRTHLQKPENLNGLHEFEVRQVMNALRHAIEYLHEKCRIEHRDLKPDNIVIHQVGRNRIYKLTDFGFARVIADQTMLKSVVGTRHYFAPEVVHSGKYNCTVDYWSIGVIAFELMCGSLPFIPHQTLINVINNIKSKPGNCIAITEDPDKRNNFHFEEHVFPEQRMSRIFVGKMENWLRIALDANYKTRGTVIDPCMNSTLKIFQELDAILKCKILTVFCLTNFQFYAYEISAELTMPELVDVMVADTGIPREQFFFIFPTKHPCGGFNANTKPVDLYAEEWHDASDSLNPPVMLFLLGYQCNYNVAQAPIITPMMRRCMQLKTDDQQVPDWVLQQFEKHTHFLLNSEQRHLEALLIGLKEYALTVENEIFVYELDPLQIEALLILGSVKQFAMMIKTAEKAYEPKLPDTIFKPWSVKANLFEEKMNKLNLDTINHLQKRYKSALRRAKEQATNKVFDELISNDIYGVDTFRQSLKNARKSQERHKRLELCQNAVINCLQKRKGFLENKEVEMTKDIIASVHKEFCEIQKIVPNVRSYLIEFKNHIEVATYEFHAHLLDSLLKTKNEPQTDSVQKSDFSCQIQRKYLTNDTNMPKSIWNVSTNALIEEAMQNLQLMELDCNGFNSDIPATIEFH